MGTRIDQKAAGVAGGGFISLILMFVTSKLFETYGWQPPEATVLALVAALSVLATFGLGYWLPNELYPLVGIDEKVSWGTFGAALGSTVWIAVTLAWDDVAAWPLDDQVLVQGAIATLFAAVFGYQKRNAASPIPGDGVLPAAIDADELAEHDRIAAGGGS
jgi:hypothetical protein